MELALSSLLEHGSTVGALALAVWYLVKRDQRHERHAIDRHKECEARNEKLEGRVETLEERQFEQLRELAERGIAGLQDSTATIKRVLRDDSITPPAQPRRATA